MKITGTSDHMDVKFDNRIARFNGELAIDGFIAYKNSMIWLPPYDNEIITIQDIEKVTNAILKEIENKSLKIYFD